MLNVKTTLSEDEQTVVDFSEGRISRQRAMHQLKVDYSHLLDMLGERKLAIPELSDEEAVKGAEKMVAFLDAMGA